MLSSAVVYLTGKLEETQDKVEMLERQVMKKSLTISGLPTGKEKKPRSLRKLNISSDRL